MLKFTLTISNESGELHTVSHETSHQTTLADFDSIESACESFVSSAIPEIEAVVLEKAQESQEIPAGLKKTVLGR